MKKNNNNKDQRKNDNSSAAKNEESTNNKKKAYAISEKTPKYFGPPFWQRYWFIALTIGFLGLVSYLLWVNGTQPSQIITRGGGFLQQGNYDRAKEFFAGFAVKMGDAQLRTGQGLALLMMNAENTEETLSMLNTGLDASPSAAKDPINESVLGKSAVPVAAEGQKLTDDILPSIALQGAYYERTRLNHKMVPGKNFIESLVFTTHLLCLHDETAITSDPGQVLLLGKANATGLTLLFLQMARANNLPGFMLFAGQDADRIPLACLRYEDKWYIVDVVRGYMHFQSGGLNETLGAVFSPEGAFAKKYPAEKRGLLAPPAEKTGVFLAYHPATFDMLHLKFDGAARKVWPEAPLFGTSLSRELQAWSKVFGDSQAPSALPYQPSGTKISIDIWKEALTWTAPKLQTPYESAKLSFLLGKYDYAKLDKLCDDAATDKRILPDCQLYRAATLFYVGLYGATPSSRKTNLENAERFLAEFLEKNPEHLGRNMALAYLAMTQQLIGKDKEGQETLGKISKDSILKKFLEPSLKIFDIPNDLVTQN